MVRAQPWARGVVWALEVFFVVVPRAACVNWDGH